MKNLFLWMMLLVAISCVSVASAGVQQFDYNGDSGILSVPNQWEISNLFGTESQNAFSHWTIPATTTGLIPLTGYISPGLVIYSAPENKEFTFKSTFNFHAEDGADLTGKTVTFGVKSFLSADSDIWLNGVKLNLTAVPASPNKTITFLLSDLLSANTFDVKVTTPPGLLMTTVNFGLEFSGSVIQETLVTPEPATLSLLGLGVIGLPLVRRLRNR